MRLETIAPEARKARILDVPVDIVSFQEAMGRIESFLNGSVPRMVVTADASGINIAQADPEFLAILQKADLVTPDSVGVLWAGRRRGNAFQERVSGVDLLNALCELSAENGHRIYFLGSSPGIAETAAERMRLKHPGTRIVGSRHGFFPAEDDEVVASEIAEYKPDVLFVAMGIPRQEKFIARTMDIIGAKVAMGVGGSLDVFAGAVKRAPRWIQSLNLEWLWRTLANPKKLAKARHLPVFVWRVLWSRR